ncbi:Tether containing UBX domain for GLUT4 [Mactra antiquata]
MAALQVLCPNGRRQNVKITPNSKLLQVLEDVCQKQKFLPTEDYKLVHGRTTLDLTLSVRYANLPNNAKLELVKAEKSRAETEVLIALQLESGDRLQHTFLPGTSLWEVLLHWENQPDSPHKGILTKIDTDQSPSVQPVCIYMREEITGELALKETKLRSLGLTGGKAVLRLLHRQVSDETLATIATKIETEKKKKARLEQSSIPSKPVPQTSPVSVNESSSKSSTSMDVQSVSSDTKTEIKTDTATISLNINVNIQSDNKPKPQSKSETEEPSPKISKMEAESEQSHDTAEPMEIEHVQINENMETDEVVTSSSADKIDKQGDSTTTRQVAVDSLRDIPGLQVFTPDDFSDLPPEQQEVARRLAQSFLANMAAQGVKVPTQNVPKNVQKKTKPKQTQAPFMDFKFPEETKGQNLYKNEFGSAKKEDFKPCDRKTLVFSIEETTTTVSSSSSQSDEWPEEFFELNENDIRSLLNAHRKRLQEMEDQPLMTSSMRKAKLEAEYSRYEKVVMRIQFQDKHVLQGLFRPRETVFALKKFVKENLEDKDTPFYLYTSPPKNVLKDDAQTLIEARLVPATVVYFGSEKQQDHYLSQSLLTQLSSKLQADMLVAECLNAINDTDETWTSPDQSISTSNKGKKPVTYKSDTSSSSSSSSAATPTGQSSGKPVPKWFKVGKK